MNSISIAVDGTGTVLLNGREESIEARSYAAAQNQAVELLVFQAQQDNESLRVRTNDPEAPMLVVSPDGSVQPIAADQEADVQPVAVEDEEPAQPDVAETQQPAPAPEVEAPSAESDPQPVTPEPTAAAPEPTPSPAPGGNPFTAEAPAQPAPESRRQRRSERESFLTQQQAQEPATQGWRGLFSTLGMRVEPSKKEAAERDDRQAVSQHWPGPRTIAIVNGKGGANKTPTTVCLSAVFARYGGGGVLAWDNNQTRGTLPWRTEKGPHDFTILDLLHHTDDLLATGAQSADLARYVHHQTSDRYDVLRSKPKELAERQRFHANDVDAIHAVATKFYRLIFIDSGNDESDPMWQRMVEHTDQLVVATTTEDDKAESAALLLETLEAASREAARLADNAVVVVSQANSTAPKTEAERVRNGFSPLARGAVSIPYDPSMVRGLLHFNTLNKSTQRAWLQAAAEVARGL